MKSNPYESPKTLNPMAAQQSSLSDGKHCPACREDIGILTVVLATLPTLIRCPHCRTRLAYRGAIKAWLIHILGCIALVAAAIYVVFMLPLTVVWQQVAAYLAIVVLPAAVLMVGFAIYLRSRKVLSRR